MPSEQPNENMDKVLKAYAKKRRDDSSQMEMDLPTRNMLQAEVKRTLGEVPVPAATPQRPRFAWWPQLIIGVASAAALAIAVLVWKLPSRTETGSESVVAAQTEPAAPTATGEAATLAVKEKPQTSDLKKDAAPALVLENRAQTPVPQSEVAQQPAQKQIAAEKKEEPAATAPAAVVANSASVDLNKSEPAAAPSKSAPAAATADSIAVSAPAATAAPTPTTVPQNSQAIGSVAAAVQTPAATPASAPPPEVAASNADGFAPLPHLATRSVAKMATFGAAQQKRVAPQKQRIQFSQIDNRVQYRVNLNSPPLPKVLTKFGLERTGTNVVVEDADGSVYSGKAFQNAVAQNSAKSVVVGASANAFAWGGGDTIPDDNFAFRVSGYNRKLRQKIVFSGNVINAAQNVQFGSNVNALANQSANLQNQGSNGQQLLPSQNLLLNGRVQVGRNSEFVIEAAPTK